ncbi:MAG: hypothetical protein GX099_05560 [Clostridiaceae bacterium]|jgi:hypothetical protein|nr:hypothetical protein [Oscillospiraceae bacterium]NLO62877.1 hypothetical protein [Clostridiaceae bacterium]
MWEEVDANIVHKVLTEEKTEAYKKFWALFILWVLICMFWVMGVVPKSSTMALSTRDIQISYMLLLLLFSAILLTVNGVYNRRVQPIKEAKYMITAECKGRERRSVKGSGDLFQGYFVSFTKPGNRDSGWVATSADFYQKCTIGTEMLVIAADQTDPDKMRAFDPADFES